MSHKKIVSKYLWKLADKLMDADKLKYEYKCETTSATLSFIVPYRFPSGAAERLAVSNLSRQQNSR